MKRSLCTQRYNLKYIKHFDLIENREMFAWCRDDFLYCVELGRHIWWFHPFGDVSNSFPIGFSKSENKHTCRSTQSNPVIRVSKVTIETVEWTSGRTSWSPFGCRRVAAFHPVHIHSIMHRFRERSLTHIDFSIGENTRISCPISAIYRRPIYTCI